VHGLACSAMDYPLELVPLEQVPLEQVPLERVPLERVVRTKHHHYNLYN